ncbi:hypothetical protein [Azospirillum picis]|uniref:Uncharacterized protein n=1 Tax=Azospirillum picis TaxID=488438 RepID=A0ABU0MGC8_9PROT|nr:hypothetical protein [Azospirillum picis]MBP2298454.1 hypothetical protein [Azospirillum picis]MDQ0532497.1 hypothetical protein [Azospirillum picis]
MLAVTAPAPAEAAADGAALPPGYVEEPDFPPEDPLPPPPEPLPVAPDMPVVVAPDAVDLLKECKQAAFTDCFRLWQPPPPPPEPEKQAGGPPIPPPPADPHAPREPAVGGPVPPTDPAKTEATAKADRATLDALTKALKDSGLDGKVLLTNPSGGDPTLKLDTAPGKSPRRQPSTR